MNLQRSETETETETGVKEEEDAALHLDETETLVTKLIQRPAGWASWSGGC